MIDYHEFHQSFLAYRRTHGLAAARGLILEYGGNNGGLNSVPENRRAELLAAFKTDVTMAPGTGMEHANEDLPDEMAIKNALDPNRIYAKWNSARKAR